MDNNLKSQYFDILGLTPEACETEIVSSYRRLTKGYDPHFSDREQESRFRAITDAFESLLSKERRLIYSQSSGANTPKHIYDTEKMKTQPAPQKPLGGQVKSADREHRNTGLLFDNIESLLVFAGLLLTVATVVSYVYLKNIPSVEASLEGPGAGQEQAAPPRMEESLPDVPRANLLAAPAPGFSVPNPSRLRFGFAFASETGVYTKDIYKVIYTLNEADGKKSLSFSESLQTLYTLPAKEEPGSQAFEYMGNPGYLTMATLNDGTVDGSLHWNDRGMDLAIHITGMSAARFSAQNLFDMLAVLRRGTESAAAPQTRKHIIIAAVP